MAHMSKNPASGGGVNTNGTENIVALITDIGLMIRND